MYRFLFKNKENGENELLWRYYNNGNVSYFKDVSLTNEVDISNYEEVNPKHDIVNLPTPYQLFGIECERGWYPLLEPIINYIDEYNKDKDEEHMIYITQIKEKFGTLRFYVSNYTKELDELISNAEKESEGVCEMCGSKNHVGTTLGWYITICHDCIKKRCKERSESIKWHNYDNDNVYWINGDKEDEYIETIQTYEEDMQ